MWRVGVKLLPQDTLQPWLHRSKNLYASHVVWHVLHQHYLEHAAGSTLKITKNWYSKCTSESASTVGNSFNFTFSVNEALLNGLPFFLVFFSFPVLFLAEWYSLSASLDSCALILTVTLQSTGHHTHSHMVISERHTNLQTDRPRKAYTVHYVAFGGSKFRWNYSIDFSVSS